MGSGTRSYCRRNCTGIDERGFKAAIQRSEPPITNPTHTIEPQRRPIQAAGHVCIGKEAHRLEERELITDLDEIQSTYADPRREPWTTHILPRLRAMAAEPGGIEHLAEIAGMSPRRLRDVLAGRSRPRHAARAALADAVTHALVQDADVSPERRCGGCGHALTAANPRRRYCSRACQQLAYRTRRQPAPSLNA